MGQVTLKQVAELTGKSEATVSLVLNGKQYHRVSAKTRDHILRVARDLTYVPNIRAQAFAARRTRSVAVTVLGMTPFYNEYTRALTHLLEGRGYSIFVIETMHNPEREADTVRWVRQGRFDGCICLEYNADNRAIYDPLAEAGIPHVFRGWDGLENAPEHMLRIDYRRSIAALFTHLAREGWRRPAVVLDSSSYGERPVDTVRDGLYHAEAARHGMILADDACVALPHDIENHMRRVHEAVGALLARNPEVDAVIVQSSSDIPAVYKAAIAAGRRVGQDLAVATFDQIPLLDYMDPPVTYIGEPGEVVADWIARDMLAQLGDPETPSPGRPPRIRTTLVTQASTQRAR